MFFLTSRQHESLRTVGSAIKSKGVTIAVRLLKYERCQHFRGNGAESDSVAAISQGVVYPRITVRMRADICQAVLGLAESSSPGVCRLHLNARKQTAP